MEIRTIILLILPLQEQRTKQISFPWFQATYVFVYPSHYTFNTWNQRGRE